MFIVYSYWHLLCNYFFSKQIYLTHKRDLCLVREDLRVITIKEYSTFPRGPGLEPHHQMHSSLLPRTQCSSRRIFMHANWRDKCINLGKEHSSTGNMHNFFYLWSNNHVGLINVSKWLFRTSFIDTHYIRSVQVIAIGTISYLAQSTRAVEYTDCFSAEE